MRWSKFTTACGQDFIGQVAEWLWRVVGAYSNNQHYSILTSDNYQTQDATSRLSDLKISEVSHIERCRGSNVSSFVSN